MKKYYMQRQMDRAYHSAQILLVCVAVAGSKATFATEISGKSGIEASYQNREVQTNEGRSYSHDKFYQAFSNLTLTSMSRGYLINNGLSLQVGSNDRGDGTHSAKLTTELSRKGSRHEFSLGLNLLESQENQKAVKFALLDNPDVAEQTLSKQILNEKSGTTSVDAHLNERYYFTGGQYLATKYTLGISDTTATSSENQQSTNNMNYGLIQYSYFAPLSINITLSPQFSIEGITADQKTETDVVSPAVHSKNQSLFKTARVDLHHVLTSKLSNKYGVFFEERGLSGQETIKSYGIDYGLIYTPTMRDKISVLISTQTDRQNQQTTQNNYGKLEYNRQINVDTSANIMVSRRETTLREIYDNVQYDPTTSINSSDSVYEANASLNHRSRYYSLYVNADASDYRNAQNHTVMKKYLLNDGITAFPNRRVSYYIKNTNYLWYDYGSGKDHTEGGEITPGSVIVLYAKNEAKKCDLNLSYSRGWYRNISLDQRSDFDIFVAGVDYSY